MSQPGVIDGLQFARSATEQRGRLGLDQLPRLAGMPSTAGELRYRLCGALSGEGKPLLRFDITGEIQLVCQRCLGPLAFPVKIESELELSEDFRAIAEADDETDRVLATRAMSVAQLVEDEVILSLPMAPRHDACGSSAKQDAGQGGRGSPFEVLAALKARR